MKLKKVLSIFMATLILCGMMPSTALANEEKARIISIAAPKEYTDFLSKCFDTELISASNHADEFGLTKDQMKECTLGEPFNVYKYTNGEIKSTDVFYYPVLYKEKIKATFAITKGNDSKIYTTFSKKLSNDLQNILDTNPNEIFKIILDDDEILALSDKKAYVIDKLHNENNQQYINKSITDTKFTPISKFNLNNNEEKLVPIKSLGYTKSAGMRRVDSVDLNPPLVFQYDKNWCWAASCASVINGYKHTKLKAEDIVTYLYGSPVNKPGNCEDMTIVLDNWTINSRYADHNYDLMMNELRNKRFIITSFNGVPLGHTMVLRSIEKYATESYDAGYINYTYMDPSAGYMSITAPDEFTKPHIISGQVGDFRVNLFTECR